MAADELVIELDAREAGKMLDKARQKWGNAAASKRWRQFVTRETAMLRTELMRMISREGPIGVTRQYRNAISKQVRGTQFDLRGEVAHDGQAAIYAPAINFGRGKNKTAPPVNELMPWLRAHSHYFTDPPVNFANDSEVRGLAFVIARNIGRRGAFQTGQQSLRGQAGPGMRQYERTLHMQSRGIVTRALNDLEEFVREGFGGGL
jgi:hypothetical protein